MPEEFYKMILRPWKGVKKDRFVGFWREFDDFVMDALLMLHDKYHEIIKFDTYKSFKQFYNKIDYDYKITLKTDPKPSLNFTSSNLIISRPNITHYTSQNNTHSFFNLIESLLTSLFIENALILQPVVQANLRSQILDIIIYSPSAIPYESQSIIKARISNTVWKSFSYL